jgi:hypothetical protein
MSWRDLADSGAGGCTSLLMGMAGLLLVFGVESMTLSVLGLILFVVALLPVIGDAFDR